MISKDWKTLVGEAVCQELCRRNGEYHDYLFLWREVWSEHRKEPLFVREWSFLDVGARQWYSMPTNAPFRFETRCMYTNDGLVGILVSKPDVETATILPNQGSRMTRIVPVPPEYFRPRQLRPMILFMDQDNPTGGHKTFIITNVYDDDDKRQLPQQLHVHDSHTDEWRGILRNQPYVVRSAATFEGTLYITSDHSKKHKKGVDHYVRISRYNHEQDRWDEILQMKFDKRTPVSSRLVVAGKLLFLVVQLSGAPDHKHVDPEPPRVHPEARPFEIGRPNYTGSLQEVYEIYYNQTGNKIRVVQFDCCQIRQMFGEEVDDLEIFPCLDSDDKFATVSSCLLVSLNSGQIRKYTLATRSVDELPQHPLLPGSAKPELLGGRHGRARIFHGANNMKLRIRNLELPKPAAITPPTSPSRASTSGK